jgi:hypothetical protein
VSWVGAGAKPLTKTRHIVLKVFMRKRNNTARDGKTHSYWLLDAGAPGETSTWIHHKYIRKGMLGTRLDLYLVEKVLLVEAYSIRN